MFNITPVGSCRIATPLRLNRDIYGYNIDLNRNYGFCHTSGEAVQQLKFLSGELDIDQTLWPLVARGKNHQVIAAEPLNKADFLVIELSSAKQLTISDTCIQINYLRNEYHEFFDLHERAATFWKHAQSNDQVQIDNFLKECWSATPNQKEDTEILRQIRMSLSDAETLYRDVSWIISREKPVLFVTHANALTLSGRPIASRSHFIDLVTSVVEDLGAPLYNPTTLMHQLGQQQAIEDYSDSLAHYTPEFCRAFFADWYDLALRNAIDTQVRGAGVSAITDVLAPHVEALLANEQTTGLRAWLDSLSEDLCDPSELAFLRAKVDLSDNRRDAAYRKLKQARCDKNTNSDILVVLGKLAIEAGDHECALDCLRQIGDRDELSSSELFVKTAESVAAAGEIEASFSYLDLAISLGSPTVGLAHFYIDLCLEHDVERLSDAEEKPLVDLLEAADIGRAIIVEALRGAKSAKTLTSVTQEKIAQLNHHDLLDLLSQIERFCSYTFIMSVIGLWRRSKEAEHLDVIELRDYVNRAYVEKVAPLRSTVKKHDALIATLDAFPLHKEARIDLRHIRAAMLLEGRKHFKDGDSTALKRVIDQAPLDPVMLSQLCVLLARLCLAEDKPQAALRSAKIAVLHAPHDAVGLILLVRAASKANELLILDDACRQFLQTDNGSNSAMTAEALKRQARLPRRAYNAASSEKDKIKAHRLLDIARRDQDLSEAVQSRQSRLEHKLLLDLRAFVASNPTPAALCAHANSVLSILRLADVAEKALMVVGRALVKQRKFEMALPYWQRAITISPDNVMHQFQWDRCIERMQKLSLQPLDEAG